MFTPTDVTHLRAIARSIRAKRTSVDREWVETWADDLADRVQAWLDKAVPLDEVVNGTPDTPKRRETINRADEVFRRANRKDEAA